MLFSIVTALSCIPTNSILVYYPLFATICKYLLSCLFMIGILTCQRLMVVSIYIYLMTTDVEYLFIYQELICMFLLERYLLKLFVHLHITLEHNLCITTYTWCPSLLFVLLLKHLLKSTWGRKGFVWPIHLVTINHWGQSGQELKQEPRQEPWDNTTYWLAFHCLPSLLSYPPQDHLPRDGTIRSKLGPSVSIINQENTPHTDISLGQCDGVNSLVEFHFPRWL